MAGIVAWAPTGPRVKNPRLIRTRLGASTSELILGELREGDNRIISGSALSGRVAEGPMAYLGRYHLQVAALEEGKESVLMGWLRPRAKVYSVKNIVLSRLFFGKRFDFNTALHGGERAIVPIGAFEDVMPLRLDETAIPGLFSIDGYIDLRNRQPEEVVDLICQRTKP